MGVGCSSTYYKQKADDENYQIIQQIEGQIFGRTNTFSVNTDYSKRDPSEIKPAELILDRMAPGELRLNLQSALDTAYQSSRPYQRQKEDLYLAALNLSNRRNAFSSIWSGRVNPDIERESDGDVKVQSRSATQLGVSKRILRTGGTISATLANDVLRFVTGSPRRSLANTLSISLSQPLLRGFGKSNPVAENLTQAERNVIYELRDFSQFQKSFAVGVVNAYFDLLGRKNTIRNNYANYISRKGATERAKARDRVERPINYQLALQAELRQKNSYIDSISAYQRSLNDFKDRLGIPLSTVVLLDDQAFSDLETTGMASVDISAEAAYKLTVEKHLPTLNEIDRFEDSKRKILVAANQLKPGLDLDGSAALAWNKEEDYERFDVDQVRANMGLVLDLPLNRVNERNSYRSTLIDFERQIRSLQQTLDDRRDVIQESLRTLDQRRKNFENNVLGVRIAIDRVREMKIRTDAGQSNQQALIDAETDLIDQQNSRINAIVDYQQTRLQLLLEMGIIDTAQARFWIQSDTQLPTAEAVPAGASTQQSPPVITPAQLFQEALKQ